MGTQLDFFVVGVQKGGTTALDSMLRRHPAVQMPTKKELHFFDNDSVNWSAPDYGNLHSDFSWTEVVSVRGEVTPSYIYWPQSLERLHAYNPNAKLIVLLRHPVFRAYSHWKMEMTRKRETFDFSDAIRAGRERVTQSPSGAHRTYSYVERGLYDLQIIRLLRLFPRNQHLFLRTDRLWQDTVGELSKIESFLGLPPGPKKAREYVAPIASVATTQMTASDHAYLMDLFHSSLQTTGALTDLDLTDWLDPDYTEPMTPPRS